ncbi:MAG: cytochrome C, partial [FCB group bacterium]
MARKKLPDAFYNPMTLAGFYITVIAFFSIVFMFIMDMFAVNPNPYLGLITYLLSPGIMVFGVLMILFGIRRRYKKIKSGKYDVKKLPVIDFNNPRHLRA